MDRVGQIRFDYEAAKVNLSSSTAYLLVEKQATYARLNRDNGTRR